MNQEELEEFVREFEPRMKSGFRLTVLRHGSNWRIQLVGEKAPPISWAAQKGFILLEKRFNGYFLWSFLKEDFSLEKIYNCVFREMQSWEHTKEEFQRIWGPLLFCSPLELIIEGASEYEHP